MYLCVLIAAGLLHIPHATIKLSVTAQKDRQMYHLINLKFTSQLNFRGAAAAASSLSSIARFNAEHFLTSTQIQGEQICMLCKQVTETVYQCIITEREKQQRSKNKYNLPAKWDEMNDFFRWFSTENDENVLISGLKL